MHSDPLIIAGRTFTFVGEADAATTGTIVACLEQAPPAGDVNLDLSGVDFIDSSALRAVLSFRSTLVREQRSLRIFDPSPAVRRVLERAGLDGIFPSVD